MVVGRKWVLKQPFDGVPKCEDFDLQVEELPELHFGEVTIESLFWSVDPYMRIHTEQFVPPITMIGTQIAKVIASRNSEFPEGTWVLSNCGWVERCNANPAKIRRDPHGLFMRAPNLGNLPTSLLLGACGMPGNTAYFGFLEICKPKAGETVVVNSAAGAIGSLVGQIAKLKGCNVVGFAGSDEKVKWLKDNLGFDQAFNYKKTSVEVALKIGAPDGVDCFFDNVGGIDATTVINSMNRDGRISACGSISTYNDKRVIYVPSTSYSIICNHLKMEGFTVMRWSNKWNEGLRQMAKWISSGDIKVKETIVDGFENMPKAFIGLFTGENMGKTIVKTV